MWSLKLKASLRRRKRGYSYLKAHAEKKWGEKSLQEKRKIQVENKNEEIGKTWTDFTI